jgi:hypothetical protein
VAGVELVVPHHIERMNDMFGGTRIDNIDTRSGELFPKVSI